MRRLTTSRSYFTVRVMPSDGPNPPRRLAPAWLRRWLERHQHPVSFWLHVVGIPMTIAALPLALVQLRYDLWELWWRPAALFVIGYALQWLGHRIEGNDLGEVILVKKLLGRPYIAISPRQRTSTTPEHLQ